MHSLPSPPSSYVIDQSVESFADSQEAYLQRNPQYDALIVGAMVYNPAGKLLLIQRASHDYMGSLWEVPGGAVDAADATVLDGLARELREETGLVLRRVIRPVRCGREAEGAVFSTRRGTSLCKFTFEVEVDEGDVRLDPNEHEAFLWASGDEFKAGRVGGVDTPFTSKLQVATIFEGFRVRKQGADGAEGAEGSK